MSSDKSKIMQDALKSVRGKSGGPTTAPYNPDTDGVDWKRDAVRKAIRESAAAVKGKLAPENLPQSVRDRLEASVLDALGEGADDFIRSVAKEMQKSGAL